MALSPTQPDQLFQAFLNHGSAIQGALVSGASSLFAGLAVIELVWVIGWSVANKSDVFDMMIAVTRFAIMVGFWYWILQNFAPMAKAVMDSFAQWANMAVTAAGGSPNLSPVDFLAAGCDLVVAIWNGILALSWKQIGMALILAIAGMVDIVIFAMIAGMLALVIAESILASYLGIMLIAMGGNSFTREFAYSPIRYVISVGVKRMAMQLIAGLSQTIVQGWAVSMAVPASSIGWLDVCIMIATPAILLAMAMNIPKIAQDVIMGSHLSSGAGIAASARMISSVAASAVLTLAGGGAAMGAGVTLAGKQMAGRVAAGTAPASAAGRIASQAGMAAGNLARAAASDIGQRMTGSYSATHGRAAWRIAKSLTDQAKDI